MILKKAARGWLVLLWGPMTGQRLNRLIADFWKCPCHRRWIMWIIEEVNIIISDNIYIMCFVEPAEVGFFMLMSFSGRPWATTTKSYWSFSGSWQELIGQRQLVLVFGCFLPLLKGLLLSTSRFHSTLFPFLVASMNFVKIIAGLYHLPFSGPTPWVLKQNEVSIDLSSGIFAESDLSMTLGWSVGWVPFPVDRTSW